MIIALAARPTAAIAIEENRNGSIAPMNRPAIVTGSEMSIDREPSFGLERREERQRGQRGRSDGEALADGSGGVADGVELVGALTDLFFELAHLGDAARVVSDRAVGVDGELNAGGESMPRAASAMP
jgi:hypothetical protein